MLLLLSIRFVVGVIGAVAVFGDVTDNVVIIGLMVVLEMYVAVALINLVIIFGLVSTFLWLSPPAIGCCSKPTFCSFCRSNFFNF